MSKKKFRVSFVLDETGSMLDVWESTISGFNEYVNTLRNNPEAKAIRFTLTTFNSERTTVLYNNKKLKNVVPLTTKTYSPHGLTPLYDAIATTIRAIENSMDDGDSVLVVIQTVGMENYSKEYTREAILGLIEEKQSKGWTFAFLGADIDAFSASAALGISKGNTISYNRAKTQETFSEAASAASSYITRGGNRTSVLYTSPDE